jgi:hypothetical protein
MELMMRPHLRFDSRRREVIHIVLIQDGHNYYRLTSIDPYRFSTPLMEWAAIRARAFEAARVQVSHWSKLYPDAQVLMTVADRRQGQPRLNTVRNQIEFQPIVR